MTINPQYTRAQPGSLPIKISAYQRRKMFDAFLRDSAIAASDTVLDIGATSDRSFDHSNYLEAWYPAKARVTALGIDDASFLTGMYPGLTFVRGDGRALPFRSLSFDYVHSSAVLEHIGDHRRQQSFLREVWRVARKGIFITTPNRWFPVEFHTVLPLVHWLPAPLFRDALRRLGMEFYAREENLNLLSRRNLAVLAQQAGIERFAIRTASLLGWPTNLLLSAAKHVAASATGQTIDPREHPLPRCDARSD
ncbi:MAG TPA: class I SAM-dependent methyltransferase [Stellaceae bacterium]|jgi:hypothetical protein